MQENICGSCNGRGEVTCQGCGGSGTKAGDDRKGWTTCAGCSGRGSVNCYRCGGSGKAN